MVIPPMLDANCASLPIDIQMNLSCCRSAIFLPRSLCRVQKPERPVSFQQDSMFVVCCAEACAFDLHPEGLLPLCRQGA